MVAHLDRDELILVALGDQPLDAAAVDHLATCVSCADELVGLQQLAALVADTEQLRDLPAPPTQVWNRIAEQVLAAAPADPVTATPPAGGSARPASGANGQAGAEPARTAAAEGQVPAGEGRPAPAAPPGRPDATHPGRRLSRHHGGARSGPRFPRLARVAVAALIGLLVGVGATVAVVQLRGGSNPAATVVATGTFTPKAAAAQHATGHATVVQTTSGRQLRISVTGMPTPQGIYEAWLYNPTTGGMIPLGAMSPDGGQYNVSGFDLTGYSVVDVSAQSFDGAEGHGQSMLQAPLA
jgi:Anti-sigma-K factor rskA